MSHEPFTTVRNNASDRIRGFVSDTPETRDASGPSGEVADPEGRQRPVRAWRASLGQRGMGAMIFALVSALVTHGYHLFTYPLYTTDEGIYMQRAWSLIHETRLSPYTYDYDHAPGGWIMIATWAFPLPHQFELFGNPMNSGRVLMLLLHVGSVFLMFEITRKLSDSLLAASIATFFFNFSPLAIYFQRQVLLDNIMVFWMLLSLYLLLQCENRLFAAMWAGLVFGVAVVTKENAIFFAPTMFYVLYRKTNSNMNRRFAIMFWTFAASVPIIGYILYSSLKNELLPSGFDFNLGHPPADHVSLLYEVWWQINRSQDTLFSHGSFLYASWMPKDRFLLIAGALAVVVSVLLGMRDKERHFSFLVVGTLALEIGFYLVRGSVILDFYVIPLIPILAMNMGMVLDLVLKKLAASVSRLAVPAVCSALALFLLLPAGGYFLVHGERGQLQVADVYYLPLTYLQNEQLAWVRKHISPHAKIVGDDDMWMALHDERPYYPYMASHWDASADPNVRDKVFARNWQNIDYIVMSNQMRRSMIGNNAGGQENWILDALNDHSQLVWQANRGNVKVQIYQIVK